MSWKKNGEFRYTKKDREEAIDHIVSSAAYWLQNDDPDYYRAKDKQDAFDAAVDHVFFAHAEQCLTEGDVLKAKKRLGWDVNIKMPKKVVYPVCVECGEEIRGELLEVNKKSYHLNCWDSENVDIEDGTEELRFRS